MRDNLEQCTSQHPACQQLDTKLPTSLIDINPGNDTFRIVETQDGSAGRYVALSYCWGSSKFSTLTTDNTMLDWTSLSSLPKSIVDAVLITKALGLSRRLDFRFAHCVLVEEIKHSRSGDDTDDSGAVRQSLEGVS